MTGMFVLLVGMLVIAALEIPNLVKQKNLRDLGIFIWIWALAGIYAFIVLTQTNVLSHLDLLMALYSLLGYQP